MKSEYTNLIHDKEHRKHKFVAIYGVFGELPDGTIRGYTEHSFSMGWSTEFVRGWGLQSAKLTLEGIQKRIKGTARYFIYRLTRRNGPIRADFAQRHRNLVAGGRSFEFRNVPFSVVKND